MYFEDATMKRIISVIMLSLAFGVATAADLQSAKDDGLVGEARSGYLAAVKTPASAEIKALIAEVNSKRRAEFEQAADKTGATVEQVQFRFYQLAVQRTRSGHYYQDQNGNWQKK